ncbi:MAG: hypothetical protein N3A57_00625, partial [Negativicutes bacterium]|nr:hypothetical protein [Negativicutes bacterium]
GPISLSLIAQLSPKKIAGFMMGANFFAMAAGGYVSGLLTSYFGAADPETTSLAEFAASYYQQFLICCAGMAVIALIYLFTVPYLKKAHQIAATDQAE